MQPLMTSDSKHLLKQLKNDAIILQNCKTTSVEKHHNKDTPHLFIGFYAALPYPTGYFSMRYVVSLRLAQNNPSFWYSSLQSDIVYEVRPCTSPLRGSSVALRCANSFLMSLSAAPRLEPFTFYQANKSSIER